MGEPKMTNFCVARLSNSEAIDCIYRLKFGDFESHAQYPSLISTSLACSVYQNQRIRKRTIRRVFAEKSLSV